MKLRESFSTFIRRFLLLLLLFAPLVVQAETYPAKCRVTTVLNVRSGPGTRYSKIGTLYPGNMIVVNSVTINGSKQWGAIDFRGRTSYVATQYLSYQEPVKQEVKNYQQTNNYKRKRIWRSVDNFFDWLGTKIKWAIIIICGLILYAFKDEIIQALVFIGMFAGAGALLFWLFGGDGSLGATIGLILGVFIGLRVFLQSKGKNFGFLFLLIYSLITIPSWISNRLQFILINPWKYPLKYISLSDSTRDMLRPFFEFLQILLYIASTPLRLVNAIYYNIFVYGITEIYDLTCEVFVPTNYSDGKGDLWRWILLFPVRFVKYPIFHGTLVLIEGMIWTVIDIIIPTITFYHGTNLESANKILGCTSRNSKLKNNWLAGTFKASPSNTGWGGLGVYFAPSRRVASSYSKRAQGVVFIACRVSLGRIINYALAPRLIEYNTGKYGRHSVLNEYANDNGYDSAEWWNGAYWEYCMYDWQNKYNFPWRIRPIYVLNLETGLAQHIEGGIRHWLFSEMVLDDILSNTRFLYLLIFAVIVVICFAFYGCNYLWNEYLWCYFM